MRKRNDHRVPKTSPLPIRFPNEMIKQLRIIAEIDETNVSVVVRKMVKKFLSRKYTI